MRGLVAHEETDYEEWGASASLRIEPAAGGRGWDLAIGPRWGDATSATDRLWTQESTGTIREAPGVGAKTQLASEIGYGFAHVLGTPGIWRAHIGADIVENAQSRYRAGATWRMDKDAEIGAEFTHGGDGGERRNTILVRGAMRW